MSKSHAKQFYLDQLKDGPLSHRKIMNRMAGRFDESAADIRDELLYEGMITRETYINIGATRKRDYSYKLTGKKPQDRPLDSWEDGTPKSRGNAFDLSTARGLFSKSELASVYNKGRPSNYNTPVQVIAYSRA